MDERTTEAERTTTTTTTENMPTANDREDVLELPESGTEAGPLFAEEESARAEGLVGSRLATGR